MLRARQHSQKRAGQAPEETQGCKSRGQARQPCYGVEAGNTVFGSAAPALSGSESWWSGLPVPLPQPCRGTEAGGPVCRFHCPSPVGERELMARFAGSAAPALSGNGSWWSGLPVPPPRPCRGGRALPHCLWPERDTEIPNRSAAQAADLFAYHYRIKRKIGRSGKPLKAQPAGTCPQGTGVHRTQSTGMSWASVSRWSKS